MQLKRLIFAPISRPLYCMQDYKQGRFAWWIIKISTFVYCACSKTFCLLAIIDTFILTFHVFGRELRPGRWKGWSQHLTRGVITNLGESSVRYLSPFWPHIMSYVDLQHWSTCGRCMCASGCTLRSVWLCRASVINSSLFELHIYILSVAIWLLDFLLPQTLKGWLDYVDTDWKNHHFHSSNTILLRESKVTDS